MPVLHHSPRAARSHRAWLFAALAVAAAAGCYREPTRFDEIDRQTQGKRAVDKAAIPGSEFNKFFPKSDDTYSVVYTQEKAGFAEAEAKKDGNVLATLAVFDTISNPDAAADYRATDETLGGYPLVDKGSQGNAVLVGDRLQVTVRSKDAGLDKAGRLAWLEKFDLANLEQLARAR